VSQTSQPERPPPAPPEKEPRGLKRSAWAADLAIVLGAFVLASALAGAFGAANLGTALSFGQIGFVLALVYVLIKR
jgi:hypothetical protein